jgi:hypothetical protein
LGDFNQNGSIDAADIDLLTAEVRAGSNKSEFDLTGDGAVDQLDRVKWVTEIKQTSFGDSNLDGQFNSTDLVIVFQAGLYEDSIAGNATWASGDWNGNGDFGSSDLVLAFLSISQKEGQPAASSVPEPSGLTLFVLGIILAGARGTR